MPTYCFRKVADFFDQPCLLLNGAHKIVEANIAARRVFALTMQDQRLHSIHELSVTPPDHLDRYLRDCSTSTVPKPGLVTMRLGSGEAVQYHCFAARYVLDGVTHPFLMLRLSRKWGTLSKFQDLSRRLSEQRRQIHRRELLHRKTLDDLQESQRRARTDQLTGLLNRNAFQEDFARVERRQANGDMDFLAFAILDLDGMKAINDRHGHEKGDEVLQCFGRVVRSLLRGQDQIYRVGGDEFILLTEQPELLSVLEQRIGLAVTQVAECCQVPVGCSLGYALLDEVASTAELYALADRRMYAHKGRQGTRGDAHGPETQ